MDDFLHNLRSGKLKQHDRSNRPFSDPQYKGGHRRGPMDRRKKDMESSELLSAVKDVLESIAETQKRMVAAYEARNKVEERKARTMEVLAQNIKRLFNPHTDDADMLFSSGPVDGNAPTDGSEKPAPPAKANTKTAPQAKTTKKLTTEEREVLCELIDKLRTQGYNWEKIAREIVSRGYSTVSGKGTWRGVMARNLYEKLSSNK